MSRGRKRRTPSVNDDNQALDPPCATAPQAKRLKLSKSDHEPDSGQISDDNTLSTTSRSAALTPSPHLNHANIGPPPHANMIDLGIEFPALPQVLNSKTIDELALDSKFDLAQCAQKHNTGASNKPFPTLFDWKELTEATDPQQLRTEALRKQERGKYVRRDSLSSEQAADRRRRQNRESARRTRDRVRKYITVLEMYYTHVQEVNSLLIKQLEVMAKHCTNQLSDEDRSALKTYSWPKPPTIEECMNAKAATISATTSAKKASSDIENSPLQLCTDKAKIDVHPQSNKVVSNGSNPIAINMPPLSAALKLPTLCLSRNATLNVNHGKQNGARTSQINIMQMNHHNNMNILNQIQAINTNNSVRNVVNHNTHHGLNSLNALRPFEQELLQCGVSLNPLNANNTQYLVRPVAVNAGNVMTFQAVPNSNVLLLPTQFTGH
eukprot:42052_1